MAVRRLEECEHDCGVDINTGKPFPDCHAEPKGICEECAIGLCNAHIGSHEVNCPSRRYAKKVEVALVSEDSGFEFQV